MPLLIKKPEISLINDNVQIRVHNNTSSLLSVRWEPHCTKVSMHRMFLNAPEEVQAALHSYFQGRKKRIPLLVRAYIEENIGKKEYVRRPSKKHLITQGKYYNLEEIYLYIIQTYFQGELDLAITWFGDAQTRHRSTFTFGLYKDTLHLVKIHRKLDDPDVPFHVIAFIIYHEMLHHVCRAQFQRDSGKLSIHTKEFKQREKEFHEYAFAKEWIDNNKKKFFHTKTHSKFALV